VFTAVAVAVVITVGAYPRSPFYQLVKNELISVVAWAEMSDTSNNSFCRVDKATTIFFTVRAASDSQSLGTLSASFF